MTVNRFATPLSALLLFLLGVVLNLPLFMPGELPYRGSIEGGYAAIARFVSEHPGVWGWNPLFYCGLPTQFLYLPALPYLTAAAARILPDLPPEYVYRLITSGLACLGPVAVFLFALYFTGSRKWSFGAALAFALVSPSYGLFPAVDNDRGLLYLPWRLQVLAKYGEGPHKAGLTLMPIELLALTAAARGRLFRQLAAAAVLLAAVALTNWVSSLALAFACVLLMLAGTGDKEFSVTRVLIAAGLAYLLACFWLTPTFIETIAFNWPSDAFGYRFGPKQKLLLAGLAASLAAVWMVFQRLRGSPYFCFVTLCTVLFGWLATGHYVFGVDTIPESRRYALEFELFLVLALAEAFRQGLRMRNPINRATVYAAAGIVLLAAVPQVLKYTTQGWSRLRAVPKDQTVEFRMARWLAERQPEGRVFASGGLRFRLNAWFDLPQVGGGFESGLRNRMPVHLAYQARTATALKPDRENRDTLLLLKALGVEYVVVHGPKSREYYRDFVRPARLDGAPVVHRDGDDVIHGLPASPMARLLASDELPGPMANVAPERLERYVAAGEDASRPRLRTTSPEPGRLTIEGAVPDGRMVGVQTSWDPGWEATQDGRAIEIAQDYLGFIVLKPEPAASTRIELHYRGTTEQRVFAVISGAAWLAMAVGILAARRRGAVLARANAA